MKGVNIIIPSYKRPGKVKGYDYFKTAKICIPAAQEADYLRCYDRDRLIVIPDDQDGNLPRKRNWILKNVPRPLLMVDDDVNALTTKEGGQARKLTPEEAHAVLIHAVNLAAEWSVKYFGFAQNTDRLTYQEYLPFSLTSPVLDPCHGHLDHPLLYDERMGSKLDFDMSLQQLNRYKKILRLNKYAYRADHGRNPGGGGLIGMRTMEFEREYCRAIERKWGRAIIRYSLNPRKLTDLLNPEHCQVPIAGV
jgi:hypothetical protein